ncbi:vacuolar protein-sorting-associated protein 37 homolog 2 [Rhagoletis pomonella]|uniref:vacuolar protein-sorting-associated protein 37 homolog 2 n=1 Tax=Rhagoletis pomonella TaxID=28610 RepID=UPI001786EA93|nr:vacuolar protein-sorting-associated protein 37 homolog 2 [Rhagoletis pomonella]
MYQEYLNQLQTSIAPLSSDELKDLLNDDEKLDEKVSEVLEGLKAQKDNLLIENRSKAESNIEKEPKIIELRGKVNELLEEAKQCCEAVQDKLAEVKEKSGNVSQETALALIQTAAAESEEATDALIKQFTDNEIGVEAFLDEFLAARKTMHLRKLKAEKMHELMRKQTQAAQRGSIGGAMPAYGNLLPNSGFYPNPGVAGMGGGSVPYPLGPMMPMPPPRPY